jgi:hypothetical protein
LAPQSPHITTPVPNAPVSANKYFHEINNYTHYGASEYKCVRFVSVVSHRIFLHWAICTIRGYAALCQHYEFF